MHHRDINNSKKPLDNLSPYNSSSPPIKQSKDTHRHIIENYHTRPCPKEMDLNCPFDFFKCFFCHEADYTRRKPIRHKNGWNYIAESCAVLEKTGKCPKGAECKFSHNNDEKSYHPTAFKRNICNAFKATGNCPRGEFCFRAHGKNDYNALTKNDFEIVKETHAKSSNVKTTRRVLKSSTRTTRTTIHNCTTNTEFYLFEYKTRPCLNTPCTNMRCCTDYHHEMERRRSPRLYSYSAEQCPEVKSVHSGFSKWSEPSRCTRSVRCDLSHTLLEQMYHPHIYKTSRCSNFSEGFNVKQNCLWGNLCTHAHGQGDLRRRKDLTSRFDYSLYLEGQPDPFESGRTDKRVEKTAREEKNGSKDESAAAKMNVAKNTLKMSFSDALKKGLNGVTTDENRKENDLTAGSGSKGGEDRSGDETESEIDPPERDRNDTTGFGGDLFEGNRKFSPVIGPEKETEGRNRVSWRNEIDFEWPLRLDESGDSQENGGSDSGGLLEERFRPAPERESKGDEIGLPPGGLPLQIVQDSPIYRRFSELCVSNPQGENAFGKLKPIGEGLSGSYGGRKLDGTDEISEEEKGLCPSCKKKSLRDKALIPCGHVFCADCAQNFSKSRCWLCDRKVERVLQLFIE